MMIDESILIHRPIQEVFAFYRDFRNLPAFLGDVVQVKPTGERTSCWTIQGPLGVMLRWKVAITELRRDAFIGYHTQGARPSIQWRISFAPGVIPGTTVVREVMAAPGGVLARAVLSAIGKPPAREVRANLTRLRELLETGEVQTLDYAVTRKCPD